MIENNTLGAAVVALVSLLPLGTASAQQFPAKPVTMVVGYNPGGGVDFAGRLFAEFLSKKWWKPVVVENKPGAGGNIAADVVSRAPADGYTLLFGMNNITIPSDVKVNFDPVKSFEPVAITA